MTLRPSSVPQRVALPSPPASSLHHIPNPESDLARVASPTITRLLATVVTDPSFESTATFALVTELVNFATTCRLNYVVSLITESESVCPPSVGGELALGCDILEDRQFELECLAAILPRFASMLLCPEGDQDAGHPHPALLHRGDHGTTLAALGFAPSTADPSLFLCTDPTLRRSTSLCTSTTWSGLTLLKSELQKRHTCTDLGELRSYLGLQITWDRALRTITLTQSHMVHQVLQRFGCQFSSPQRTPLRTCHSPSAPPSDESLEPSGLYPELVGCLISEAEIYAGAMAAQELRWLSYLLTELGERPRSPPVLYVDNKAMVALCREQRLEHRTKHIALRYVLARELQQRCHLRLAYVASQANTADVLTKALVPGDHQRFCTALGLMPTVPHLLVA
ncbi:unnamed protein product [Closterium sp. NIES-54]